MTFVRARVCVCVCVHYSYTYIRTYVPRSAVTAFSQSHTRYPSIMSTVKPVCTYVRTYVHTYVRTYVHTYVRTYIRMYTSGGQGSHTHA